jgi:hypothetical protein
MILNERRIFINNKLKGSLVLIISYLFIYYLYYSRTLDYTFIEKLFYFAPKEHISKITQDFKKYIWTFPTVVVLFIVLRVAFLSLVLLMGSFISEKKEISFKLIISILLFSEFVFLLRDYLIIGASLLSKDPHKPSIDLSLSMDKLFNSAIVSYPGLNIILKSFSVYLVAYFLVVSFLLSIAVKSKFKDSLIFILIYMGTGYLIWLMLSAGINLYASY